MAFQLSELLPGVTYASIIAGVASAIVVVARLSRGPNLDAFPTVGSSTVLGSWWSGFKYVTNATSIIQQGYDEHKFAPFKIANKYNWMVILSNREHIEELCRAPDDVISFTEAVNDRINFDYTLGHDIHENPYHISVVRSQLTRNIGTIYPEIRDEIVTAFEEVLDLKGNEWKSVPALSTIQTIVCRTSNRLFVGLPLCRNPDWIDLNIRYAFDVVNVGLTLGLFPKFMRPLVVCFFTGIAQGTKRGLKHLGPIIEERLKCAAESGNKTVQKPNDVLSWLMDEAEGRQLTVESLVPRVLVINFGAIHASTSSASFTHALLYLAANPHYVQPLREEVECIVENEGWSKAALGKMRKVDSFLKECLRVEGTSALSIARKTVKDYTFSDGTVIPKGTLIGVPNRSLHHDANFYENANVFEPFRFAEMREDGGEGAKHQLISTCPGRFFAASELKSMLAHVVTTYDIKLEDETTRPRSLHFGNEIVPDPNARVLFRKREST